MWSTSPVLSRVGEASNFSTCLTLKNEITFHITFHSISVSLMLQWTVVHELYQKSNVTLLLLLCFCFFMVMTTTTWTTWCHDYISSTWTKVAPYTHTRRLVLPVVLVLCEKCLWIENKIVHILNFLRVIVCLLRLLISTYPV